MDIAHKGIIKLFLASFKKRQDIEATYIVLLFENWLRTGNINDLDVHCEVSTRDDFDEKIFRDAVSDAEDLITESLANLDKLPPFLRNLPRPGG